MPVVLFCGALKAQQRFPLPGNAVGGHLRCQSSYSQPNGRSLALQYLA